MKHHVHLWGFFLFAAGFFCPQGTFGFKYYWVGNTGNWSDYTIHWATTSGGTTFYAHIPYATDTVYFDANSFSLPDQSVTIDSTIINCADMIWTGITNAPVLGGPSSNTLKIYGSLVLDPGMKFLFGGPVSFESTHTGKTITSAGKPFNNSVTFNGIGGGWTLMDALTVSSPYVIHLNNGTLHTNDQTVSAYSFFSVSLSTRSIVMGSSVFNLSASGAGSAAWWVTKSNMSVSCGQSTINCTRSVSAVFDGGSFTYNNLNFTNSSPLVGGVINCSGPCIFRDVFFGGNGSIVSNGNTFHNVIFTKDGRITSSGNKFNDVYFDSTGTIADNNNFINCLFNEDASITGSNTYDTLTFSPGHTYTLAPGKIQNIISVLNVTGNGSFPIRIQSATPGKPSTIYKSSRYVCADFVLLSDNTATGGALFNAGTNSADYGGNSGWNFPGNCLPPVAAYESSTTLDCVGDCINFTDLSTNATSWHWSFEGGIPATSSKRNPENICYMSPGMYNVTLVATNVIGNDTASINNYITIHASPAPAYIVQSNDTLFCSPDVSYSSYQWFLDSVLIPGATDAFYVVTQSGNYNVQVFNEYGCSVATGVFAVGIEEVSAENSFSVFPNPVENELRIDPALEGKELKIDKVEIYNIFGEDVYSAKPGIINRKSEIRFDVSFMAPGIYFLQVANAKGRWAGRFVKV